MENTNIEKEELLSTIQSKSQSVESISSILQNHPYYLPVKSFVLWEDPIRTGLIFAIGNLVFFLLTMAGYSILSLLCTIFVVLMVLSFFLVHIEFLRKVVEPYLSRFSAKDNSVSPELMNKHVETLLKLQETLRLYVCDILYFTDTQRSLKAGGIALFLYFLGNLFSDIMVLYILCMVIMIWPICYKNKKTEIDNSINFVLTKLKIFILPLLDKLPPPVKEYINNFLKQKKE